MFGFIKKVLVFSIIVFTFVSLIKDIYPNIKVKATDSINYNFAVENYANGYLGASDVQVSNDGSVFTKGYNGVTSKLLKLSGGSWTQIGPEIPSWGVWSLDTNGNIIYLNTNNRNIYKRAMSGVDTLLFNIVDDIIDLKIYDDRIYVLTKNGDLYKIVTYKSNEGLNTWNSGLNLSIDNGTISSFEVASDNVVYALKTGYGYGTIKIVPSSYTDIPNSTYGLHPSITKDDIGNIFLIKSDYQNNKNGILIEKISSITDVVTPLYFIPDYSSGYVDYQLQIVSNGFLYLSINSSSEGNNIARLDLSTLSYKVITPLEFNVQPKLRVLANGNLIFYSLLVGNGSIKQINLTKPFLPTTVSAENISNIGLCKAISSNTDFSCVLVLQGGNGVYSLPDNFKVRFKNETQFSTNCTIIKSVYWFWNGDSGSSKLLCENIYAANMGMDPMNGTIYEKRPLQISFNGGDIYADRIWNSPFMIGPSPITYSLQATQYKSGIVPLGSKVTLQHNVNFNSGIYIMPKNFTLNTYANNQIFDTKSYVNNQMINLNQNFSYTTIWQPQQSGKYNIQSQILHDKESEGENPLYLDPTNPISYEVVPFVPTHYFTWNDTFNGNYAGNLVANPNNFDLPVRIQIPNAGIDETYVIPAGGRITPFFENIQTGPIIISTKNGEKVIASQRTVFNFNGNKSFNEYSGIKASELSNKYYFTWNDTTNGNSAWTLIANPSTTDSVNVEVKIGGIVRGNKTLTPGEIWTPLYPNIQDGPVEVTSTGGNVIATQRVIYAGSFNEFPGNSI